MDWTNYYSSSKCSGSDTIYTRSKTSNRHKSYKRKGIYTKQNQKKESITRTIFFILYGIAYLAENEKDFYERLDRLMDISARSLKIKRTFITKLLDAGLYPYTKRYLGTFDNHFSTNGR